MWPEDERRSASRYNTIAVMHKHKIAGEVEVTLVSKKMVSILPGLLSFKRQSRSVC